MLLIWPNSLTRASVWSFREAAKVRECSLLFIQCAYKNFVRSQCIVISLLGLFKRLRRQVYWWSLFSLAVEGILKGYDQLLNLVLDETVEYLRGKPLGGGAQDFFMRRYLEDLCIILLLWSSCWWLWPSDSFGQTRKTCWGLRMRRGLWDLW